MAGVLEGIATEQPLSSTAPSVVYGRWDVQYARFVLFPSSPHASHPSLVPHSASTRKARRGGKWISTASDTSSSTASLKLLALEGTSLTDQILVVSLGCKILEEHYISRLHFAWPQVSCVSGFPSRGTRSVFVSYKDHADQIQKFGLRFLTIYEIEKFMTDLKENMEALRPTPLICHQVASAISSQSEFIPSNEAAHRVNKEGLPSASADTYEENMEALRPTPLICHQVASGISTQSEFIPSDEAAHRANKEEMTSASADTFEVPASTSYEVSQDSNSQESRLHREAEEVLSNFPPSFTSFLMNCGPPLDEQVAVQPATPRDNDLKAQIMKYMEDSSFQDMLLKVEQVINEVGDISTLL
ncbi:unnamed protein product [Cuscuta epithymum]|uniref:Poor homologous synapsis 1 PH domain-containing protein n=1 Tax=Cuscuta epithymum TaxID=186058 RepID=A0AAV0CLC9_9ASTE|nr:unnamed protein product [Cuscuta epithymum]